MSFYRNWTDYENGFGSARSEIWLGKSELLCIRMFSTFILKTNIYKAECQFKNRSEVKFV